MPMDDLKNYSVRSTDWRTQIQKNKRRSRVVIFLFVIIYLCLGIGIDAYIYDFFYHLPIHVILKAMLRLELFPYATLSMVAVSIISLFITYAMYDRVMLLGTDYHEVTLDTARDLKEKQLYNVVEEMKVAAGLEFMPRVYIIDADYMNAFASGYSEKSAMVAITRGLMEKLDRSEMQAVMAHELSHVRHLDIKLTLTASVLSNIILIVLDILFYNLVFSRNDRRGDPRLFFIIMLLRYLLPVITILLMLYLSRSREYMADAGCVELMRDNEPMARALLKIHQDHQQNIDKYRDAYGRTPHEDVRRAAYLYDPVSTGVEPVKSFSSMFSTHPSLEQRLKALGIVSEKDPTEKDPQAS